MLIPGIHRNPGFLDLVCDAAFQLRLAGLTDDSYLNNRHSRASIMASVFSLECAANALLQSLSLSAKFANDLDHLPTISKFETFMKIAAPGQVLDRGDARVSKVQELISVRNGFVHPKTANLDVKCGEIGDLCGEYFSWPFEFEPESWQNVQIPKPPLFWLATHAKSALTATTDFLNFFFTTAALNTDAAREVLYPRLKVSVGDLTVSLESIFDEFAAELEWAVSAGINLKFLGFERK